MDTILLLAHTDADGALPRPAFEALAAATQLAGGAGVTAALFGASAAKAAASLGGAAAKVLVAEGEALSQPRYATDAAAATALARAS